jgi:hypothetical protein
VNLQELINVGLGAALTVIGWFARELWSAVKQLKEDLNLLRVEIPKTYVAREDFRSDMREIKDMLTRIFDKLDDKQDKVWPSRDV